jgi:hypothetical protein
MLLFYNHLVHSHKLLPFPLSTWLSGACSHYAPLPWTPHVQAPTLGGSGGGKMHSVSVMARARVFLSRVMFPSIRTLPRRLMCIHVFKSIPGLNTQSDALETALR